MKAGKGLRRRRKRERERRRETERDTDRERNRDREERDIRGIRPQKCIRRHFRRDGVAVNRAPIAY